MTAWINSTDGNDAQRIPKIRVILSSREREIQGRLEDNKLQRDLIETDLAEVRHLMDQLGVEQEEGQAADEEE